MKRGLLVLALVLGACKPAPVRVVCTDAGSVVFDQVFERAEIDGERIVAWHDGKSATLAGECAIAPARAD